MNKKDKQLCEALGLDPKLLSQEPKTKDILSFHLYALYRHDGRKGSMFVHREHCLRDMLATKGKQMYGMNDKTWEKCELYEYEKEKLNQLRMIEVQKKRYSRGRYKT